MLATDAGNNVEARRGPALNAGSRPNQHATKPGTGRRSPAVRRGAALFVIAAFAAQVLGITVPAAALAADSTLTLVSVDQGNPGSSYQGFNGSGSDHPNPQDLTAFGSRDWALWGYNQSDTLTPSERKQGGSSISALREINPAPARVGSLPGDASRPFRFSWSDGAPDASAAEVDAGIRYTTAVGGSGFGFSVRASATLARLVLFASVQGGDGVLTAKLPGISRDLVNRAASGSGNNDFGAVYTIDFAADSGDLDISYTLKCPNKGCTTASRVTIYAAALSGGSDPIPSALAVQNPTPETVYLLEDDLSPVEATVDTAVVTAPVDTVALTASSPPARRAAGERPHGRGRRPDDGRRPAHGHDHAPAST